MAVSRCWSLDCSSVATLTSRDVTDASPDVTRSVSVDTSPRTAWMSQLCVSSNRRIRVSMSDRVGSASMSARVGRASSRALMS